MPSTDFDFVHGSWSTRNRRRRDPLDATGTEWDEFDSSATHTPLPAQAGNLETYATSEFPGLGVFHGLALRLYEPDADEWRIWWSSSATPGLLDPPLVGRFDGARGEFLSRDVVRGVEVGVRFVWLDLGPTTARWEQAIRRNDGDEWDTNWVMEMSRAG